MRVSFSYKKYICYTPSDPKGTASLCVKRGSMATPAPRGGSDPFKGTGYEHSAPCMFISLRGGGIRTPKGHPGRG
jgi:hypothetical protein